MSISVSHVYFSTLRLNKKKKTKSVCSEPALYLLRLPDGGSHVFKIIRLFVCIVGRRGHVSISTFDLNTRRSFFIPWAPLFDFWLFRPQRETFFFFEFITFFLFYFFYPNSEFQPYTFREREWRSYSPVLVKRRKNPLSLGELSDHRWACGPFRSCVTIKLFKSISWNHKADKTKHNQFFVNAQRFHQTELVSVLFFFLQLVSRRSSDSQKYLYLFTFCHITVTNFHYLSLYL